MDRVLKAANAQRTLRALKVLENARPDCSYCASPCCSLIVVLTDTEVASGNFKNEPYVKEDGTEVRILPRTEEQRCVYSEADGKCSIYDRKPDVCNRYTCKLDTSITDKLRYPQRF